MFTTIWQFFFSNHRRSKSKILESSFEISSLYPNLPEEIMGSQGLTGGGLEIPFSTLQVVKPIYFCRGCKDSCRISHRIQWVSVWMFVVVHSTALFKQEPTVQSLQSTKQFSGRFRFPCSWLYLDVLGSV